MSIYTPYTYLVRHKPSNTFYYGVRWKNVKLGLTPEQDLWNEYFTRSSKVAKLIEEYGVESFEFEIRKTFSDIATARKWESKVLRRMKVLSKPTIWLNRTDNKAIVNDVHPKGTLGKTWKNITVSKTNTTKKIGNTYTKGRIWINNGSDRKMISKDSNIPAGYVLGSGVHTKRPDLSNRNKMRADKA